MSRLAGVAGALKSRHGALGALAVTAILGLALVALAIMALFRTQDDQTDQSLRELALLRAEAATAPALHAQLATLRQDIASSPGALSTSPATLAQSQLQQSLESLISGNGGSIRSTQLQPVDPGGGFAPIAIQHDLIVPMSKLQTLVYAIESHSPYLFLDNVQIAANQAWQASNTIQDPQLTVHWTIRAYRFGAIR